MATWKTEKKKKWKEKITHNITGKLSLQMCRPHYLVFSIKLRGARVPGSNQPATACRQLGVKKSVEGSRGHFSHTETLEYWK